MKSTSIKKALPGLLVCMVLFTGCRGKSGSTEPLPWLPETLAAATELINKNCPEMIDPDTRLDSVSLSEDNRLSYFYTLPNKENSGINSVAFKAYLIPEIIDNVRLNSKLSMHRDSSVIFIFYYRDREGILITDFSVGPEQYR
jgi:hypothetical protein